MKRTYHTLFERVEGKWFPQFGDYDILVVRQERRDMHECHPYPKLKDLRIVSHDAKSDPSLLSHLIT